MASKSERLQFESLINNDRQNIRSREMKKVEKERNVETRVHKIANLTKRDIVWEERRQKRLSGQIEKLTINNNTIKDNTLNLIDNEKNKRIYNFDGLNSNNFSNNQQVTEKLHTNTKEYNNYSKQSTPYNYEMYNENTNNYDNQKYMTQNVSYNKVQTPQNTDIINNQINNRNDSGRITDNREPYNINYQKLSSYDEYNKKVNTPYNEYNKSHTPFNQNIGYDEHMQNNQFIRKSETPYQNQNIQNRYTPNNQNISYQTDVNNNYNQQRYTPNQQFHKNYGSNLQEYNQQRQTPNQQVNNNYRQTPYQQVYDNSRQTPSQQSYENYRQTPNQNYNNPTQPQYYNNTYNQKYQNGQIQGYSQRNTPMQYQQDQYNTYQNNNRVFSPDINNQMNNTQRNPIIQNRDTYTPSLKPFSNVSFRNNDMNRNNSAYLGRENNKFSYKI